MTKLIKVTVMCLFFILGLCSLNFAQEEESITITTYYPSPYGSYNELTTHSNTYLAIEGGSVGIGTTGPRAKLDVYGNLVVKNTAGTPSGAQAGGDIYLGAANSGAGAWLSQREIYVPMANPHKRYGDGDGIWNPPGGGALGMPFTFNQSYTPGTSGHIKFWAYFEEGECKICIHRGDIRLQDTTSSTTINTWHKDGGGDWDGSCDFSLEDGHTYQLQAIRAQDGFIRLDQAWLRIR